MRYELTDYEWATIKPFLPNKPRGVPRVNDRRVLNGIFWVLRSGAPWRDLPESFGPYTTCYNRFVRWRRAGVWDRIMNALTAGHDAAVQMIDTSIVRVHQHGACIAANSEQLMGRSRGGLTTKIHAVVDTCGAACSSRADHWRDSRQPPCPHPVVRSEIGSHVARGSRI
jgi:transposase